MSQEMNLSHYQALAFSIVDSVSTLSLATLKEQKPEVSLVPFLYYEGRFWVFVSQLSPHTQSLLKQNQCSILAYNNQTTHHNHFAVERVSAFCRAQLEEGCRELILDLMANKLGGTMSLLRQFGDFHLFSLTPIEGRFIAGFGKAFTIDFPDFSLAHIDPSNKE